MGTLVLIFLALFGTLAGQPRTASAPPPTATPAPEAEGEATPKAAAASGRALVVGDSLAVGTEAPLAGLLPGWHIRTSAYTGRHTDDGVAEILGTSKLPPVLVVSLGTNDDPSAVSSFESSVEAVLQAAGEGRCVVWANIVRPPYNGVSYGGYNRALAQVAAAHPNLTVVDWAGLVHSNPGVLAPDGVHATPSGYQARAEAIAQAMQTCGGLGVGE
ncbi:MAG TPA: GDSL-type esterase/lipase family protein [Solirubrobacterales bacterium]|jgi:lysophospholipase L1-like esterase